MKRPTVTITVKALNTTTGYDAGSLHINFNGTVTFFSSGNPITVPGADIVKIDYHFEGAEWCATCDQSIQQFSIMP